MLENIKGKVDFILDRVEKPEKDKSDAQKADEAYYNTLVESANARLSAANPAKIASHKVAEFIHSYSSNSMLERITSKDILTLMEDKELVKSLLTEQNNKEYLAYKLTKLATSLDIRVKEEDVDHHISKADKQIIELIKQAIRFEQLPEEQKTAKTTQAQYNTINEKLEVIRDQEKARKELSMSHIVADKITRGSQSSVSSALWKKVSHPVQKILDDPKLNTVEKLEAGVLLARKPAELIKYVTKKAVKSAKFVAKHNIKQPVMTLYRAANLLTDAVKYADIQIQIAKAHTEEEKEMLNKEAIKMSKNMGYEAEKFARALVATAATAGLDLAIISTGGAHAIAGTIIQ